MANVIQLLVNGAEIDFKASSDLSPRITRAAFDPDNIDARVGDYTINVNLPKTPKTLGVLGFLGNPNDADAFYALPEFEARIRCDSIDVFIGKLLIVKASEDNIECALTGASISWADALREKTLRQITSLGTTNYGGLSTDGGYLALDDYWALNEGQGDPVQFPLVSYGNFASDPDNVTLNPINGVIPINESFGRIDGAVIDNAYGLAVGDFRGAGYLKSTLRALFKDAGYRLTGSFMSDPDFDNILLPFTDADDAEPAVNIQHSIELDLEQEASSGGGYSYLFGLGSVDLLTTQWEGYIRSHAVNTVLEYRDYLVSFLTKRNSSFASMTVTKDNGYTYDWDKYRLSYTDAGQNFETVAPYFTVPEDGFYRMVMKVLVKKAVCYSPFAGPAPANYLRLAWYIQSFTPDEWEDLAPIDTPLPDTTVDRVLRGFEYVRNNILLNTFDDVLAEDYYTCVDSDIDFDDTRGDKLINCDTGSVYLTKGTVLLGCHCAFNAISGFSYQSSWGSISFTFSSQNPKETDISVFLPDTNQLDFVKNVVKNYNIYFTPDEINRTISLDTRPNYSLPPSFAVDWSDKANIDKAVIKPPQSFKQYKFEFEKEDGEVLFLDTDFNRTYESPSKYFSGVKEITTGFAATGQRRYTVVGGGADNFEADLATLGTADEYRKKLGELGEGIEEWRKSYLPRFLKWLGVRQYAGVSNYLKVTRHGNPWGFGTYLNELQYSAGSGNPAIPLALFVPDIGAGQKALSFKDGTAGDGTALPGTVTLYWQEYIELLQRSFVWEADVQMSIVDVAELNVRRLVYIGETLFEFVRLEDFDPINEGTTKVKLLRKL